MIYIVHWCPLNNIYLTWQYRLLQMSLRYTISNRCTADYFHLNAILWITILFTVRSKYFNYLQLLYMEVKGNLTLPRVPKNNFAKKTSKAQRGMLCWQNRRLSQSCKSRKVISEVYTSFVLQCTVSGR